MLLRHSKIPIKAKIIMADAIMQMHYEMEWGVKKIWRYHLVYIWKVVRMRIYIVCTI